jgi:fibronectin-binding autotransporter adhesin
MTDSSLDVTSMYIGHKAGRSYGLWLRGAIVAGLMAGGLLIGSRAAVAQVSWISTGSTGNWATGTNWSGGVVPAAGSVVALNRTLPSGTSIPYVVTYDSVQPTISSLTINTGNQTRTATVDVTSTLTLSSTSTAISLNQGGRMNIGAGGSVVVTATGAAASRGSIALAGGSVLQLDGGRVEQNGSSTITALTMVGGAEVRINSGTFTRVSGAATTVGASGGGTFTMNGGRFEADTAFAQSATTVSSTSRIAVNAGSLVLATASSASVATVLRLGENSGVGTYVMTIGGTAGTPFVSVTNVSNNAEVRVGAQSATFTGTASLALLSGTLTTNNLNLAPRSGFTFAGGALNARIISSTNGNTFVVGSGTQAAALNLLLANGSTSVATFGSGLTISEMAALTTAAGTTTITSTAAPLTNLGTFLPGGDGSVGRLAVTGNVALGSSSLLSLDVSGTNAFDTITSSGSFAFGGTLQLNALDGFQFAVGQSFKLFDFAPGQATGSLTVSGPNQWDTSTLLSNGTITLLAVPEPSGCVLAAAGVGLLIVWRRRRRRLAAPSLQPRDQV